MACNLRCPYCFEPHKLHETSQVMTESQVEAAFEALDAIREQRKDLSRAGYNLFGGEPLLPTTKKIVESVVQKAAQRHLYGSITTNGTHLHQFVDILYPYRTLLLFQITIDGSQEIHDKRRITAGGKGTFEQIISNIELYLSKGFKIDVRMNLNEENIHIVPELLQYLKEKKFPEYDNFCLSLSPVTNYTGLGGEGIMAPHEVEARVREQVPMNLLKEVKVGLNGDFSRLNLPVSKAIGESFIKDEFMPSLFYCEASGGSFYVFAPDGNIYPCNQIIADPSWAIGTYDSEFYINQEAADLWHGRDVSNMPQCMECSVAFLCSGGCPVMANRKYGSPMASYCGTSKKELHDYLDSVAPKILSQV
ncbi:radical SAM protein [Brevibacillus laterosporus]|uniref:Radical SAM protein n=1 Tax=Brevibacillus laterosporus TaxID=1465 RepID=A0A518V8T0_BRELA|nr:radical SAM protein [Brevibacillus laterosporus]